VEDIGDIDVKGLAQRGVCFRTGIDEGVDAAFPRNGNAAQQAGFVAVYRVPLRGTVGVVILRKVGVPGRFREEHRTDPRFFANKEVKTAVNPLFYPEIIPLYRQVLTLYRDKTEQEQPGSNSPKPRFPYHRSIIGQLSV
jgi:hypothetical protein